MSKGIINSNPVREMVGLRIQSARKDKKLSRSALAELIVQNELCPAVTTRKNTSEIKTPAEALADRLKQWEYGNNPVDLEYIPAICNVLECDTGYLFAEYPEKSRVSSDLCSVTGLSERAVVALKELRNGIPVKLMFIDYLLRSEDLPTLLEIVADSALAYKALQKAKALKRESLITEELAEAELSEYRAFKTIVEIIKQFSQEVANGKHSRTP